MTPPRLPFLRQPLRLIHDRIATGLITAGGIGVLLAILAIGVFLIWETLPLLAFNAAAKRIMFTTLGLIQYIGPTLMFIFAVGMYDEPLEPARLVTFGFVCCGLVLFSLDSLKTYRQQRKVLKAA